MRKENVIEVLARGDKELFHSAFLAWLMDSAGSHELGCRFLQFVLHGLAPEYAADMAYDIETEAADGDLRFDILVKPKDPQLGRRGLVIENKVKSFGFRSQAEKYRRKGYDVGIVALLDETLDEEIKEGFNRLLYREVLQELQHYSLDLKDGYHFLVDQYRQYLEYSLKVYDLLGALADHSTEPSAWCEQMRPLSERLRVTDNDVRTLDYFYYYRFARYLRARATDLVFGDLGHDASKNHRPNTGWVYKKNVPGRPFMEAVLYDLFAASGWSMHPIFGSLCEASAINVIPRLELWLHPRQLVDPAKSIGRLMLGTGSPELLAFLRATEPYKARLHDLGNTRNFHVEPLYISDLPFQELAARLRAMLDLLFDRPPGR